MCSITEVAFVIKHMRLLGILTESQLLACRLRGNGLALVYTLQSGSASLEMAEHPLIVTRYTSYIAGARTPRYSA